MHLKNIFYAFLFTVIVLALFSLTIAGALFGSIWLIGKDIEKEKIMTLQAEQNQRDEVIRQIKQYREITGRFPDSLDTDSIKQPQPALINLDTMKYTTSEDHLSFQIWYGEGIIDSFYCYYSGETDKPLKTFNSNIATQKDTWQYCWSIVDAL